MHVQTKLVVLGDTNVGKTSLLKRLALHTFDESALQPTVGADMVVHTLLDVPCPAGDGGGGHASSCDVTLHCWDVAGADCYRSLVEPYVRRAGIVLLCYDATEPRSLLHIQQRWFPLVDSTTHPACVVALVGLKADRINAGSLQDTHGVAALVTAATQFQQLHEDRICAVQCASSLTGAKNVTHLFRTVSHVFATRARRGSFDDHHRSTCGVSLQWMHPVSLEQRPHDKPPPPPEHPSSSPSSSSLFSSAAFCPCVML